MHSFRILHIFQPLLLFLDAFFHCLCYVSHSPPLLDGHSAARTSTCDRRTAHYLARAAITMHSFHTLHMIGSLLLLNPYVPPTTYILVRTSHFGLKTEEHSRLMKSLVEPCEIGVLTGLKQQLKQKAVCWYCTWRAGYTSHTKPALSRITPVPEYINSNH